MKFRCLGLLALASMALCLHAADKKTPDSAKSAETASAESAPKAAPEFKNTWALNGAYSLASLKDKVVVLYFYESG